MAWLEMTFSTTPKQIKRLESALLKAGALAVTLKDAADEPILEPGPGETPLWGELTATALFPEEAKAESIIVQVQRKMHWQERPPVTINVLPEQNWERAWMDEFKPMQFGQRLWITPSGMDPVDANAVNIILDPGLAFGTGTHPTTAMCLSALDGIEVKDLKVIDFGCGSGILALAAIKLGAKVAHCIDNDPQALIATRDNAIKNGLSDKQILTYLPDEFKLKAPADILLANILAGPLMTLCPLLCSLVKSGAYIILSGILHEQEKDIKYHYGEYCDIAAIHRQDDWSCVVLTKR